jgi:hypothetical protein
VQRSDVNRLKVRSTAALVWGPIVVSCLLHCGTGVTPSPSSGPAAAITATPTAPVASRRVLIGSNFNVEAGGCETRAERFEVVAPGRLDTTKGGTGGVPPGFEIVVGGNGDHGVQNITVTDRKLTFTLRSKGDGALIGPTCLGPRGANSSANVYAYVYPD